MNVFDMVLVSLSNPMRSEPMGITDVPAMESDERLEAATAVARVPDYRAHRKTQNGNH